MKIVKVKDLEGTDRDVEFNAGRSLRILLEKDNMGFSLHKTIIKKGTYHWHYKNHLESCYCISGKGWIKDISTGIKYEILPDTTYVLDNHDNHEFTATEDTVLMSVFNPPITGDEIHQKDGSYKLINNN
tara:strand:- start:813 stop:1199 length:387 start_codon:yes stop_codon:yes gene_type:complete